VNRSIPRVAFALLLVAVAGAYLGTAKIGIGLSVAHGVITPVWAPSGIALAALLIFGFRVWPAVALGAFVANATSGAALEVAAWIAVGNTLEPMLGGYLLRRAGVRLGLERVRDVLALVVLAAGVSTTLAAPNGVTAVRVGGDGNGSYGSDWLLWWFGDAVGVLMVAPFLLVAFAATRDRRWPARLRLAEGAALLGLLAGASAVVFLAGAHRYPYLIFPVLLLATFRFHQLGAAAGSLLVGAFATWGTVVGSVPIATTTPTSRVQLIQALVGVLAISLLVMGATLAERARAGEALERAAVGLSEAQALAHVGSWEWDVAEDVVTWSDELYRIYGFEPGSAAVTYDLFLSRVHPDDRAFVEDAVQRAYVDGQPFAFEHRIVLPDGAERLLASRGRVVGDGGRAVRMVGTGQDITEQRQVERLRDDILSTVSHELRTPLTSVLGFAMTLRERGGRLTREAADELVEQLLQQAHRLDALLSNLLDLDRLRRGLLGPARQPTDVARLVRELAPAHETEGRAILLSLEPVVANVDPAKVERMVDNLLANAVRHTPDGSSVEVRLETLGDDLLLVVEDNGPGVSDEFKQGVFELFNRGPKIESGERGSGVGLSLVARFAALHGGRAWVEDGSGGGASFHVLFPGCVLPVEELEAVPQV
jgi:signal transduction histidine kinase